MEFDEHYFFIKHFCHFLTFKRSEKMQQKLSTYYQIKNDKNVFKEQKQQNTRTKKAKL
jgi:hypothetical protein